MNTGSPDAGTEIPTSEHFHRLTVGRVVHETDDATTVTFDVPESLADRYRYRAGQFVTLRLVLDGEVVLRSYSMSSAPDLDDDLAITVKRVPGGLASNWINDELAAGDSIQVSVPAGRFVLTEGTGPVVAVAGGSGITPVYSIVKTALAATDRHVRLLFANAHRGAAIFGDDLDGLAERHPDRFRIVHHEDCARGLLDATAVAAFVGDAADPTGPADVYVCGPTGLMALVEATLAEADVAVDAERIHVERFVPPPPDPIAASEPKAVAGGTVTITAGGRTETVDQRDDFTVLHLARWVDLPAPSSCETGHCGSCMARLLDGEVEMRLNDALTAEEVAEGLVLTCQALPRTAHVRVDYDL